MDEFYGSATSADMRKLYSESGGPSLDVGETSSLELGPWNTHHLISDPRRLGFVFARHKFVSKMLAGFNNVLEIGCQEGLGSIIVSQAVKNLVAVDFFRDHIESCQKRLTGVLRNVEFRGHDMLDGPIEGTFDGAFSMDVVEHIDPQQEYQFMGNITGSLSEHGVLVLGTPSLESQQYASPHSKASHVNCKSGEAWRALCREFFNNVFIFGMNDEIVHTGFLPMSHYIIALCVQPKSRH